MTETTELPDKIGHDLIAQRFQMLEDIAKELAGEVLFPTCFDVAVRLKQLLDDPDVSLERVATTIRVEPLISSKLIARANAASMGSSRPVRDVGSAVQRLGLTSVRTISLAVAMKQMLLSRNMVAFDDLTHKLWQHSLQSAAAAGVIARRLTRINPDEAYLAGMVHDLGAFYMLYRAALYPELVARPESTKYLVAHWHDSIGVSLMGALGLPEDIVLATHDHDCLRTVPDAPRNLSEVVYAANIIGGAHFEWLYNDQQRADLERATLPQNYLDLDPEIQEATRETNSLLA